MQTTEETDPLAALRGRTVLVADDEYFLATEITRRLGKAGAAVVGPFPTVGDALAAVEGERSFDVALLDINLRGELVYPLADLLGQRGVPFVFMTGYDRAALPATYKDVPICDKPVDIGDFARKLAAVIDAS